MMVFPLQIIGLLFAVGMLYLTFLYYKKNTYDTLGFLVWACVWIGFIVVSIFPTTVYAIMQHLEIERTVDFFVIGGFLVFSVIVFRTYVLAKQNQHKLEKVVTDLAMRGDKK